MGYLGWVLITDWLLLLFAAAYAAAATLSIRQVP